MRPPPYKDARSIRRCRTFCAVIVTSGATPAAAQETCWTARHAQFFNAVHYCVSSALTPQGDNNYGPEHFARWEGDSAKACEGVRGNKIGETITIRIEGAVPFHRLLVATATSVGAEPCEQWAEQSGGDRHRHRLQDFGEPADRSDILPLELPNLAQHWIQLKTVDVYPD